MSCYFVTGTDTDAGKTLICSGLLALGRRQGLSTLGLKPVASGCDDTQDGLRNIDALTLQAQTKPELPYDAINPFAFAPPIAPHLAARYAGTTLRVTDLENALSAPLAERRELALIEGAGGWRVPLNDEEDIAALATRLSLPVILVVGLKLGCLNHALLSAESILRDGCPLAGWVGNVIDPGFAEDKRLYEDNIRHLEQRIAAPCLGIVPRLPVSGYQALADAAANHLSLPS